MTGAKSLLELLAEVPDPRGEQGKYHPLSAVLGLTVVAMLAGVRGPAAIAQYGRDQGPWLALALGFRRYLTPSKSMFSKLFRRLDAAAFEAKIAQWLSVASQPGRQVARGWQDQRAQGGPAAAEGHPTEGLGGHGRRDVLPPRLLPRGAGPRGRLPGDRQRQPIEPQVGHRVGPGGPASGLFPPTPRSNCSPCVSRPRASTRGTAASSPSARTPAASAPAPLRSCWPPSATWSSPSPNAKTPPLPPRPSDASPTYHT
jgi:hypothetical protein